MENKLTLEHLAPYLPYEVRIKYNNDETSTLTQELMRDTAGFLNSLINVFKPILRPLSDLTKEIEHNGEKFVPIDYINGEFSLEIPNKIELQNWVKNRSIHFVLAEWVGIEDLYKLFNLLFQWHFDVFGLIDKGLAVDINTLKGGQNEKD